MSKLIELLSVCITATGLTVPALVNAAANTAVSCSVAVDYVFNGAVAEEYRKDFFVEQGVAFVDDFSTRTRSKTFTATVAKDAGDVVVAIDYFNDVGVFLAMAFNTRLTIHGGGGIESTSGSHTSSISSGVSPEVLGGSHATNYTLICRRA